MQIKKLREHLARLDTGSRSDFADELLPHLLNVAEAAFDYTSEHRNCWCPVCNARVALRDMLKERGDEG